jgi:hypothetical protein
MQEAGLMLDFGVMALRRADEASAPIDSYGKMQTRFHRNGKEAPMKMLRIIAAKWSNAQPLRPRIRRG